MFKSNQIIVLTNVLYCPMVLNAQQVISEIIELCSLDQTKAQSHHNALPSPIGGLKDLCKGKGFAMLK